MPFSIRPAGMSGTLVLRGEPGIGKTSILLNAETGGRFPRTTVDGVQAEESLGFAGLHRLLLRFSESPNPYLRPSAEHEADGGLEGGAPDRFLIGLALLTLLSGLSAHAPLLCIIDDAQWLDGETKELLAFIARRLFAESLVLLVAVRGPSDGPDAFTGLPELEIRGLESTEAWGLLSATFNRQLDVAMMGRLVRETEGNPLALLEPGHDANGDRSSVLASARSTASFESSPGEPVRAPKLRGLPEATQQFLLVAAARAIQG